MKIVLFLALILNLTNMKAQNLDPWTEYIEPSKVHTLISQYEGNFKMEIKMSMGEGKEPSITIVEGQNKMLLGGRFLELKQNGTLMGMDYQSIMTMGFNNTDKKMALTTITNMGTGTLSLFGYFNEDFKTAALFGQLTNPDSKNSINVKQVVSFIDNDTIKIESFDKETDEPEKKTVEYLLIRIK